MHASTSTPILQDLMVYNTYSMNGHTSEVMSLNYLEDLHNLYFYKALIFPDSMQVHSRNHQPVNQNEFFHVVLDPD